MRAFGFGPGRRPRTIAERLLAPSHLPLSTPILFEGDSNTAWSYQATGWVKQVLRLTDARFYLPVGGDFAVAGCTVQDMVARQATVVAKVRAMVALAGHCILWFQIGTNGGTLSADLPALATYVAALRGAGARVCANTCPTFGQVADLSSYVGGLNAWLLTADNVDVTIDVNALPAVAVVDEAGQTHYTDAQNRAVGEAVAAALLPMISADSVYDDPAMTVIDFAGTGGTLGAGVTGQLPDGCVVDGFGGTGTATIIPAAQASASRPTVRLALTCTAADQAVFSLSQTVLLSVKKGDVADGALTVGLIETSGYAFEAMLDVGGGQFPSYLGTPLAAATWGGDARVWRVYPVNQTADADSIILRFEVRLLPGQTATVELAGFAYAVREHSAVIAPTVAAGSAAPVIAAAKVGTPLAVASNGSYAGTQPITLAHAFYVAGTAAGASYTPVAADAGNSAYVVETATNAGGSISQQSAAVTIAAGTSSPTIVATTLDPSYSGGTAPTYSNGDRTACNNDANYQFVPSVSAKTTGRYYFEVVNDRDLFAVGVGSAPFGDAHSVLLLRGGSVYHGGDYDFGYAAFSYVADGSRIGVDVDLDAGTVRFRVNGGAWSAPIAFAAAGPVHAYVDLSPEVGSQGTARFAAADWADVAPDGARVWET